MTQRMQSGRGRLAMFSVVAALSSASIANAADNTYLPAQICSPSNNMSGSGGTFHSDGLGILTCSITQDQALDTNDDLRIYFVDNNDTPNTSGGVNVWCWASEVDEDWSSIISLGNRYGCAAAGGCATDTGGTYTGSNWITFADIAHGGAYSTAVSCVLPPYDISYTRIKSFVLDEQ